MSTNKNSQVPLLQIAIHSFILWIVMYSAFKYLLFKGQPGIIIGGIKDIFVIMFIFIGLLLVASRNFKISKQFVYKEYTWFIPVLVLAFTYCLVDIVKGQSIINILLALRDFIFPFLLLLIGVMIGGKHDFKIKNFLLFFSIISIITCLYAIYQFFFFDIKDILYYGILTDPEKEFLYTKMNSEGDVIINMRVFGIFNGPLEMSFASIVFFYNAILGYTIDKKNKLIHSICLILSVIVLFLTFTRVSLLALVFSMLFMRSIINKKILASIIILGIPLVIYFIYKQTITSSTLDPSTIGHIVGYLKTFDYVAQSPMGYGISFCGARDDQFEQFSVDGNFNYIILNFGIIGLFVYYFTYIHIFQKSKKYCNTLISEVIRSTIIASILISFIMFIHPGSSMWMYHLWVGLLLGFSYRQFVKLQNQKYNNG